MKLIFYDFNKTNWMSNQIMKEFRSNFEGLTMYNSVAKTVDEIIFELKISKPTHVVYICVQCDEDRCAYKCYFPMVLAILCKSKFIHFTYITQVDDDHKSPTFVDDILYKFYSNCCLNLKMNNIVSSTPDETNLITKLKLNGGEDWEDKTKQIRITVLDSILTIICDMIKKNICGSFDVFNDGSITIEKLIDMFITNPTCKNSEDSVISKIISKSTTTHTKNMLLTTQHMQFNKLYTIPDLYTGLKCVNYQ